MADWEEEYKRKFISADEAASFVKSGDYVAFTLGREGLNVGLAIAARKEDLRDVKTFVPFPGYDFGWYDPGWEDSFSLLIYNPTAVCQEMVDERRCDLGAPDMLARSVDTERDADVLITEVSAPDSKGFCSFGQSLWNKRKHIKKAKLVIGEVNKNLIPLPP